MSAATEQTARPDVIWPPALRAELDATPPSRRPWSLGIGPAYLAIFVWAPFFDPLWRGGLTRTGVAWLTGSVVVAGLLCFGLFYYPAAMWGYRTGRRLGVVAALTFGTTGSDWLTGVGLALAEIVWFAVAIDFAVQTTLLGLVTAGLVPPYVLATWQIGTLSLRGPIFLATALFWIFVTGLTAMLRLTGVIAALMRVYSPVALVLLAITAVWMSPGLSAFPADRDAVARFAGPEPVRSSVIPLFTGFFAMVGLLSVDWGASAARRRDVVVGGMAGVVLAGCGTALLSLVVVAGAVGRLQSAYPVEASTIAAPPPLSFRWGVVQGVSGTSAAVILVLFGLAALAPACFSSSVFIRKLSTRWPRLRRIDWAWIACTLATVLVATGWASRLEAVDALMGGIFAPMAGAMAGDYVQQRGRWAGVRQGIHWPGVIAWLAGVAIGPLLSAPVAGFLISAVIYCVLARLGLERPAIAVEVVPGQRDVPGGGRRSSRRRDRP